MAVTNYNEAQRACTSTRHYGGTGAAATSTTGTDTAGVAGRVWLTEVFIPAGMTITGIAYLIGTVGGTDKTIVSLYDNLGKLVATSAVAGVTTGTLATYQSIPFIAPQTIIGPGLYFIGVQTNGTTATIRTAPFGAKATGTSVPTTFTANVGPLVMTY